MDNEQPKNTKPVIILLPGMDGTGELLQDFAQRLSDEHDVRVVSYPEDVFLTYEQLAEHARTFIPDNAPYMIVAESFSGPVGCLLAAEPVGDLQAVVFVSSFVSHPLGRIGSFLAKLVPTALFRVKPPAWAVRRFLMDAATTAQDVAKAQATIARIPSGVMAKRLRAALNADFASRLEHSAVRTACLVPESDRLPGFRGDRTLLQARPDMATARVPGPHFLLQCAPEHCMAALQYLGILEPLPSTEASQ